MGRHLGKLISGLALILSFFLFNIPAIYANYIDDKATVISGIVVTNNGEPAPGVTVIIQELSKGAITNENGLFNFKNIPVGTYHLKASLIGLEPVVIEVTKQNKSNVI